MLSRLTTGNFRSIQRLDIPLGAVNIFVGPNNAGKSNILQSLQLLLGEIFPSTRSFDERDYYFHNPDLPITITAWLDNPIPVPDVFRKNHEAWGFQLQLTRYKRNAGRARVGDPRLEYVMIDKQGAPLKAIQRRPAPGSRPFAEPVRVSNDFRDTFPLLYVGVDRNVATQLRGGPRTFLGRVLRELNKDFVIDSTRVATFEQKMNDATAELRTVAFQEFEAKFRDEVRELTGLHDFSLGFRNFDPIDHYRLLELYLTETPQGIQLHPDEMGTGTQSALAIALAHAYAHVVRQHAALAIEEPELFLHPHACRYIFHSLERLASSGIQVFYSTHNSAFVDLGAYANLYVVRRVPGEATTVAHGRSLSLASNDRDRLRLHSRFDTSRNEVFFAHCVLLVEGPGERSALKSLPDLMGIDFDKQGLSVVDTDGKPGMVLVEQVLQAFQIPFVCLVDDDAGKPTGQQLTRRIEQLCGAGRLFVMSPDFEGVCGATSKLDPPDAMQLFRTYKNKSDVPSVIMSAVEAALAL